MKLPNVIVKRSYAGLGLFAGEEIKKGQRIIEYTGERLPTAEADRRGGKYLFVLDDDIVIDGKGRENTARYINHACKPNAEAVIHEEKYIFIEAKRTIKPGEEITYDYGKEYWLEHCQPCRCAHCVAKRENKTPTK